MKVNNWKFIYLQQLFFQIFSILSTIQMQKIIEFIRNPINLNLRRLIYIFHFIQNFKHNWLLSQFLDSKEENYRLVEIKLNSGELLQTIEYMMILLPSKKINYLQIWKWINTLNQYNSELNLSKLPLIKKGE